MFTKGEVSLDRLERVLQLGRARALKGNQCAVSCACISCGLVYSIPLRSVLYKCALNVPCDSLSCCFTRTEPVRPWEMFHSGRCGDKDLP